MFSQASVILFTGGEACMARGACVVGGMSGRGACMAEGACMTGGVHGKGAHIAGGHVWQGGGACVAGETATAADGMHPTGMHSCP